MNQNDLDWFAARLSIAVYDTNNEFRAAENAALIESEGITLSLYQLRALARKTSLEEITMSITGASYLSTSIKDMIADAKAGVAAAHAKIGGAVDNLKSAAVQATSIATAIQSEADDLMSGLGQFTNGGPADEPKATPLPAAVGLAPAPTAEPKKNEGA